MKTLLLTFNLACGADAATTHLALAQGGVYREAWFPSQNPWVINASAASQGIGTSLALRWLDRHGHGKTARIIGWSITGAHVVATAHNFRALRQAQRR